jgi:hypothetical protein
VVRKTCANNNETLGSCEAEHNKGLLEKTKSRFSPPTVTIYCTNCTNQTKVTIVAQREAS